MFIIRDNFWKGVFFMTMATGLFLAWKIFLLVILIVILGGGYYVVCRATGEAETDPKLKLKKLPKNRRRQSK